MSSDQDPQQHSRAASEDAPRQKKRRLHGACDTCRKRKVKCDSAEMSGNICTNCIAAGIKCSHDIPREPKKSEKQQAYIVSLEAKIKKLESYIHSMHPNEHMDDITPKSEPQSSKSQSPNISYSTPPPVSSAVSPNTEETEKSDEDDTEDDLGHISLSKHLNQLSLEAGDRFYGQSSVYMFSKDVSTFRSQTIGNIKSDFEKFRRPIYWQVRPWEMAYSIVPETSYVYPEVDLIHDLSVLYFERINILFPIIHRPTFIRSLSLGQHIWDSSFGMTVLMVCAIGARYSRDPRVNVTNDPSGLSAGWDYFRQVPVHRRLQLYRTSHYDIQYYCLAGLYLLGTSIPYSTWNIVGLGMRYAIGRGIHRRKAHSQKPNAEDESARRAFWCLFCLDRIISSFTGRPCVIHSEEFDVEYPIECDDEYWETSDPDQNFKQPAGKPCTITGFVSLIKLCEILEFSLRALYTTKKSKILAGHTGTEWEGRIVSQLDASLHNWKENLAQFLRWDPSTPSPIFFHQSVVLYATYYYAQIQIHRPFLTKKSPLSFRSLAICTSAASACTQVLEAGSTRGLHDFPNLIIAAFSAGLVIVMNLWGNQRSGFAGNTVNDVKNLQACLHVLKEHEKGWHLAGRLRDLLSELGSMQDYKPSSASKRRFDTDSQQHQQQQQQQSYIRSTAMGLLNPLSEEGQGQQDFQFGLGAPGGSGVGVGVGVGGPTASDIAASTLSGVGTSFPASLGNNNNNNNGGGSTTNSNNNPTNPQGYAAAPYGAYSNMSMSMPMQPQNDWDLSNLLLLEMGYVQANNGSGNHNMNHQQGAGLSPTPETDLGSGSGSGSADASATLHVAGEEEGQGQGLQRPTTRQAGSPGYAMDWGYSSGGVPGGAGAGAGAGTGGVGGGGIDGDIFALWKDIPGTFSGEEWETYLGSVAQHLS